MKRIQILVLGICAVVLSCGCNSPSVVPQPTQETTPTPIASSTPPVDVSAVGVVTFKPVEYFTTPEQRKKIISAGKKMNEVKNSDCAHEFLKNRKMIDIGDLTSLQVADLHRQASGEIPVKIYYRCMVWSLKCLAPTSAVAYRQPPESTINLNGYAFTTDMSDCEWAETMDHESVGHSILNFDHSYEWTPQRDFSAPYSFGGSKSSNGNLYERCCRP
jgi:hypothetical protein